MRVNRFMERVDAIYSDPGQRNDIKKWESLFEEDLLENSEIREILLYRTFYYFVEQRSLESSTMRALPNAVTRQFAEYFGWINAEAQLTGRFGKNQVDQILNHAYRRPTLVGANFINPTYRPGGYSSLYRRLLIILGVCSLLIIYFMIRHAIDAVRQDTPYYVCKVLFTDQASQQDYSDCEAAAENDDKAQLLFALALLYSTKFKQEPVAALSWLNKAADRSNARAMYILGALQGEEIKTGNELINKDFVSAVYWLEQAAKAGEIYAYTHLASLYVIRNRADQDMNLARQNLILAADAEQPDAFLGMALFELHGLASNTDYKLSRTWLNLYARTVIPAGSNEAAWLLATSPNEDFRDPAQAMEYINLLNVDAVGPASIMYLDTVAAVYAANGSFNQAIAFQTQAIAGLKKQEPAIYQDNIQGFQGRMNFYQKNKFWIEALPDDYLQQRFADLKDEIYNRQLRAIIMETQ